MNILSKLALPSMEYQDIWQQLQPLPLDAQALVADFIVSLKQRYNKSAPRKPEQKDWRSASLHWSLARPRRYARHTNVCTTRSSEWQALK